jgi:hypothetical protein
MYETGWVLGRQCLGTTDRFDEFTTRLVAMVCATI